MREYVGNLEGMAGLAESCSHVGATLFALHAATNMNKNRSVTDVTAYWKNQVTDKFSNPHRKVSDLDFSSKSKRARRLFEVEPETNDPVIPNTENIPSPTKQEQDQFFAMLAKENPTSAVLSLNSKFCKTFAHSDQFPTEIPTLFDKSKNLKTAEDVMFFCSKVGLHASEIEVKNLEMNTKGQSSNRLWFRFRAGRITGSVVYDVFHTDISKPSLSVLNRICYPDKCQFFSEAVEWGKKKENIARKLYCKHEEKFHTQFTCTTSGFVMQPGIHEFGASPDGLVSCSCCGDGCVEIKCPFLCRNSDVIKVDYLEVHGSVLALKSSHRYYFQIQLQMFVTGCEYCDFVVWTPKVLHAERIVKDVMFCKQVILKCKPFFYKCILPEVIFRFFSKPPSNDIPNNILCSNVEIDGNVHVSHEVEVNVCENVPASTSSSDFSIYCTCHKEIVGADMVCCDNPKCRLQWFHFKCVGVVVAPKGTWFCNDCKCKDAICKN